jgi:hypothetical protein
MKKSLRIIFPEHGIWFIPNHKTHPLAPSLIKRGGIKGGEFIAKSKKEIYVIHVAQPQSLMSPVQT